MGQGIIRHSPLHQNHLKKGAEHELNQRISFKLGGTSYSYDAAERVVGDWFGRTLYQKTAEFLVAPKTTIEYKVREENPTMAHLIEQKTAIGFAPSSESDIVFIVPGPLVSSSNGDTTVSVTDNSKGWKKTPDRVITMSNGLVTYVAHIYITFIYTKTEE